MHQFLKLVCDDQYMLKEKKNKQTLLPCRDIKTATPGLGHAKILMLPFKQPFPLVLHSVCALERWRCMVEGVTCHVGNYAFFFCYSIHQQNDLDCSLSMFVCAWNIMLENATWILALCRDEYGKTFDFWGVSVQNDCLTSVLGKLVFFHMLFSYSSSFSISALSFGAPSIEHPLFVWICTFIQSIMFEQAWNITLVTLTDCARSPLIRINTRLSVFLLKRFRLEVSVISLLFFFFF